jgi:hypothetical protein
MFHYVWFLSPKLNACFNDFSFSRILSKIWWKMVCSNGNSFLISYKYVHVLCLKLQISQCRFGWYFMKFNCDMTWFVSGLCFDSSDRNVKGPNAQAFKVRSHCVLCIYVYSVFGTEYDISGRTYFPLQDDFEARPTDVESMPLNTVS